MQDHDANNILMMLITDSCRQSDQRIASPIVAMCKKTARDGVNAALVSYAFLYFLHIFVHLCHAGLTELLEKALTFILGTIGHRELTII